MTEAKSIWIITEEAVTDTQDESGSEKKRSQKTSVKVDDLKNNVNEFCRTVEEVFAEAERSLFGIQVEEMEMLVQIDDQGKINLLGTFTKDTEIDHGIRLKFKRQPLKMHNEQGIDYKHLRDLLALEKWKEADTETNKLMCQIANRVEDGWLTEDDLSHFPTDELQTINKLWLHYSDRQFGFSVQAKIYRSLGGTTEYSKTLWEKFGDSVGWRKDEKWLQWADYHFELNKDTPKGHLPTPGGMGGKIGGLVTLLSRKDI